MSKTTSDASKQPQTQSAKGESQPSHAKGELSSPLAKREVRIHLTHAAAKIVSAEEAPMLVKLAWKEMEQKKEFNLFRFTKLGVCLIRDGDDLTIMTARETANALGEKMKEVEVVPEKGIAG